MLKERKYELVDELAKRLEEASTVIVADYRGLSVVQFDELRTELYKHGATFTVVKNTLTIRAAEKAGVEGLDEYLAGPSAIAFVTDGDMVATAKALVSTAKETKVLTVKGGILDGRKIDAAEVGELATLPPLDTLQGTLVGVIAAPLTHLVSLIGAPLRDVVGVLDARSRQLEERGEGAAEPAPTEASSEEPDAEASEAEAPEAEAADTEAPAKGAPDADAPGAEAPEAAAAETETADAEAPADDAPDTEAQPEVEAPPETEEPTDVETDESKEDKDDGSN